MKIKTAMLISVITHFSPIISSIDSLEILNPNAFIAFLSSRASMDLI